MRYSGSVSEKTRVAVLMGGWSSEREVSLMSGQAVVEALRSKGYEVMALDPPKDLTRFAAQLVSARPDVIFNALHGIGGEDGVIQGALEMSNIPYTHSGVKASALAMDKVLTKIIARTLSVTCAEEIVMERDELVRHPMELPYVVKPVEEGSSVGITIVRNDADRLHALRNGDPGQFVMVERYIEGEELTSAVLETEKGLQVLGITRLESSRGFYDYESKYTDGVTRHTVNPELPKDVVEAIHHAALVMHRQLGCHDVSRCDFRYNPKDGVVFLEINTHPGLTKLSLLPEQAAAAEISFPDLIVTLIESARRRFKRS